MPYLGHSPTQSGSFVFLDDIDSGFDGSETDFTMQVGSANVTPKSSSILIALDGVLQQSPSAYTVSGSTLTFTEAPVSGQEFYGILMGQSASIGAGTIDTAEIADNAITSAKIGVDVIVAADLAANSVTVAEITDAAVTLAKIQNVAANSVLGRNANSSGVLTEVALADTQLLIGDGTGFTAATLSGDVTMANTGAVTVGTLNQNTTGSSASCTGLSATATALATGRTLAITGEISYTSPSFDGTGNVTAAGTVADDVIDEANLKSDNGPTNDYVLTAKSSASGGLTWAAAASGSDTPWTEVHNFAGYYYDMTVQTKPGNPSANNARFYIKEIDTNNDGLFCILRKNGSDTQEVQIV